MVSIAQTLKDIQVGKNVPVKDMVSAAAHVQVLTEMLRPMGESWNLAWEVASRTEMNLVELCKQNNNLISPVRLTHEGSPLGTQYIGETLQKLRNGDSMTDDELSRAAVHMSLLSRVLVPMGESWALAREAAIRDEVRLREFCRARKLDVPDVEISIGMTVQTRQEPVDSIENIVVPEVVTEIPKVRSVRPR